MAIIIKNKNEFESKLNSFDPEKIYVNFDLDSIKFTKIENKIFSTCPNKRTEKLKKYMKKYNIHFLKLAPFPKLKIKMEK